MAATSDSSRFTLGMSGVYSGITLLPQGVDSGYGGAIPVVDTSSRGIYSNDITRDGSGDATKTLMVLAMDV